MLRSIEEVAIQLGVSKTSIYNKLKLKEYKSRVVKKHGKSMVDDELFNLIQDGLKLKNKVENQKDKKSAKQEIAIDEDGLFNFNQELIRNLIEQLKEKDKQIEELINLNKNNQILLKQQQDKEINQKLLEDHFQEVDLKLMDLRDRMEEKKNSKKFFGFFSK